MHTFVDKKIYRIRYHFYKKIEYLILIYKKHCQKDLNKNAFTLYVYVIYNLILPIFINIYSFILRPTIFMKKIKPFLSQFNSKYFY